MKNVIKMAQPDGASSLNVRHRFSTSSSSFLNQLSATAGVAGIGDQEMDVIMLDHCYSKPWSAHPDASSARPVRMLFMPKQTRPSTIEALQRNADPLIDVVEVSPTPSMPFDINKARNLMTECERHATYARTDNHEDWEEKISKSGWTIQQTRLFTKVMKILQADRLARLAMDSVGNEPIARRQVVDKTARRMRQALASVGWDTDVVQWLHQLILDSVSVHLLACYLDALQTLKAKIPSLVEKMVGGTPPKHPSLSLESLGLLLKRPWDPIGNALTQQKLKKLPGNPLLLIAPSGPSQSNSSHLGHAKRLKFWQVHLNSLGKTIPTNMSGGSGVSVVLCLEQMIGALRTKVVEQKSHHPNRPVILLGWNIGALVACHVSLVESVNAVVCLGFPFTGLHGPRGDCEDLLLDSQTPTLFVIGQNASDCSVDQLQDLREHMHAETGMVVVGGADEQLRLSHRQKREEGLTQAMADRCIIDELYQFLGSILAMNTGLPDHPASDATQVDMRKKRKRKVPRDILSVTPTDSALPSTTAGQATNTSPPVAVASGVGRVSKRGGKAARMMTAVPGSTTVTAERGRPGPRKRQSRGGLGAGARKRMALGLSQLGAHTMRSPISLQSANAATLSAISSAPELSGLLQGIRVSRPSEGDSVVMAGARSLMSSSFHKMLAFNKQLGAGEAGSASATATLLASAVKSGESADKDKLQPQFLVKAASSTGSPLTIPISLAQRLVVGGSSPLVHITGAGSSCSSQIQQLLTSIARSSSATLSTPASPHTALLINTSLASTLPPVSLPVQPASRDKPVPGKPEPGKAETGKPEAGKPETGKPEPGELGAGGVSGEKAEGVQAKADAGLKETRQDCAAVSTQSSQISDVAPTIAHVEYSPPALPVLGQMTRTSVNETTSVSTQSTQSKSTDKASTAAVPSQPILPVQAATTKQASLTNLTPLGQQAFISKPIAAKTLTSMTLPALVTTQASSASSPAPESKTDLVGSQQASPLVKSSFVQLAVTKSLIQSGAVTSHSILGKVVAGSVSQAGRAGSPTATSSILGGRSAVLISPAIAKSLSSASTAILLSKAGTSSGTVTTNYKPTVEMLGKVSSVLESSKLRPAVQPSGVSPSIVSVPFSVSKSGVINALGVSKPVAISQTPPSPVCVSSLPAVTSPIAATSSGSGSSVASSSSGGGSGGGGRGSHKSVNAVSYAASSKPVLPTPTSTRTRKIKTPKQYDL